MGGCSSLTPGSHLARLVHVLQVAELEAQISQIDAEMLQAGADASKTAVLLARKKEAERESEQLLSEWEQLEALLAL